MQFKPFLHAYFDHMDQNDNMSEVGSDWKSESERENLKCMGMILDNLCHLVVHV